MNKRLLSKWVLWYKGIVLLYRKTAIINTCLLLSENFHCIDTQTLTLEHENIGVTSCKTSYTVLLFWNQDLRDEVMGYILSVQHIPSLCCVIVITFSHFIDWMYWDRSGPKIPGCLSVCVCLCVCLSVFVSVRAGMANLLDRF